MIPHVRRDGQKRTGIIEQGARCLGAGRARGGHRQQAGLPCGDEILQAAEQAREGSQDERVQGRDQPSFAVATRGFGPDAGSDACDLVGQGGGMGF